MGLLTPWRIPYPETFMCALSTWQDQIICSPKWAFEGELEDMKILCSNPQKALPCMNNRLLVYQVSKSVQRPKRSVGRKIVRRKKEINK